MKTSELDYKLERKYIAQNPPARRGSTNLLVFDRKNKSTEIRKYSNFVDYLKKGDTLVLNKTKVEKYRLYAINKRNNRDIEILLLNKIAFIDDDFDNTEYSFWYALIGYARYVKIGDELLVKGSDRYVISIVDRKDGEAGFILALRNKGFRKMLSNSGHTPLPPYIKRLDTIGDYKRYNTIFAKIKGSVASPTAGLNITKTALLKVKNKGVNIAYVNLQVGWGTFSPIRTENVEDFKIHEEFISISQMTANIINKTILSGGSIFSVGTTATRTLETVAYYNEKHGKYLVKSFEGITDIFIYPGYKWKVVDHLITNFHAPKTSLVALVSSFVGSVHETMELYELAKKNNFKFLSYGDSMLIL